MRKLLCLIGIHSPKKWPEGPAELTPSPGPLLECRHCDRVTLPGPGMAKEFKIALAIAALVCLLILAYGVWVWAFVPAARF